MSRAILTLPMMPVDGENIGKFVTPIICESLKYIYGAKYYHCINLLDSFNDREKNLEKYIDSLNKNDIKYDELWLDKNKIEILLNNINQLIKSNNIREIYTNIYKCDCGIVEIEENKINSCNQSNLKFKCINDELYCKTCKSKCKKSYEKILIFSENKIKRKDIIFLPHYLNKDTKTYENTILNSYITISRSRNTGIKLKYNGTFYNIDIDFLWATYLANFEEKEKIIVSGNKMLYQLFLVGMLEKCFNPYSNTILLGTPYIDNIKDIKPEYYDNNKLKQKLVVLLSTKWQNKNVKIDQTLLNYLNKLNQNELNKLYNILCDKNVKLDNFVDSTNNIIRNQYNMQNCIKKLKLERRNNNV